MADRVLEVEYGYAYRHFTTVSTQHDGPYFLNWGLEVPAAEAPALDPADEADRLSIQLYHRVTAGIDLAGKSVLEVSSDMVVARATWRTRCALVAWWPSTSIARAIELVPGPAP